MRFNLLLLFICSICVGCSGYTTSSQRQGPVDIPTFTESHDQALGWLVTARYKDMSNTDNVMALVGDFCKSKEKQATLYKTTAGTSSEIVDVWACQTPPILDDTDVLRGIYCHFIAIAPRYSVDFTNRQKETAENEFIKIFTKKGIEYPVGGFYEKYQNSFASWAIAKQEESATSDKVRQWFDKHCQ